MLKKEKGITLIALVLTIIVLLILAGVSIAMLTGDNGILTQAQNAKEKTESATIEEQRSLAQIEAGTHIEQTTYTETVNGKTMIVPIPAGFAMTNIEGENSIEDGLVIIDSNGNEYVWIPCTIDVSDGTTIQYGREEQKWGIESDNGTIATKDELTLLDEGVTYSETDKNNGINETVAQEIINQINAEKESIEKYKGFYIGRYEVGKENNKAVIKKNMEPYTNITWQYAYKYAKDIGGGSEATTYLCSSYAWDTALKYIESKPEYSDYGSNISKYNENCFDKDVLDEKGNIIKKAGVGQRLNTGLTTPICNIYDMGGNVIEFTTELIPGVSEPVVLRGGFYSFDINNLHSSPTGYRWDNWSGSIGNNYGFRATLFLK